MDIFICNSCGNEFSVDKAESVFCPVCGKEQNVSVNNGELLNLEIKTEGQAEGAGIAKLDEFASALAGGAEAREFSINKMRNHIASALAEAGDYEVPEAPPQLPLQQKEQESAYYRHEVADDPLPTPRQLKKAEKRRRKQEKLDEKERRRNEKIDRQRRRNSNKLLAVSCVLLLLLFAGLSALHHFNISFLDIPDVLTGAKSLRTDSTTKSVTPILEQVPEGPTAPAVGEYLVSDNSGLNVRKSATAGSERLVQIPYGATINITSIKPDADDETVFWGRVSYGGALGWVNMSYVKPVVEVTMAVTTGDTVG